MVLPSSGTRPKSQIQAISNLQIEIFSPCSADMRETEIADERCLCYQALVHVEPEETSGVTGMNGLNGGSRCLSSTLIRHER